MRNFILLMLAVSFLAWGCNKQTHVNNDLGGGFSFDLKFKEKNKCNGPFPEVVLSNVPAGTAVLEIKMIDLDYMNKDHGLAIVQYSGNNTLPEGMVSGIFGPCPERSGPHRYKITIEAKSKDGRVLGTVTGTRSGG